MHIVKYENALYKIQQGEELKNRSGEILTEELIEERIADRLEKYEWEYDKLEFFEKNLEEWKENPASLIFFNNIITYYYIFFIC